MQYGYFDDAGREYVITNPRTPVKWINYIGTLSFGGFVDQTGGALLCKNDPALNRITKYLTQTPASDFKGETLYLRVHDGAGGYKVFSPFFVPTLDRLDCYECRVGLGYTRMISECCGIQVEATIFVPAGADCEVRDIRVTNRRRQPVSLDAVPVVEYTHPDALKQLTNADWVPQTMTSKKVDLDERRMALIQYPFMLRDIRINYFTASLPASSFETDRAYFLGDNEYGTWARPLSLFNPALGNHEALRGDNIAALLIPFGDLGANESRQFVTLLGQSPTPASALPTIEKFIQEGEVDRSLADLKLFWDAYLEKIQVHTPDANMDRMLNIHNPRQCYTTKNWSRYLSYYQLGYGARGIGFRDSSQDVMAVLASAPAEGKELLKKLLQVQKRDGSAMHQFNPLTMVASEGDSLEREDRPHYYSDDHLWGILAVTAYLKETGDFAFLDEEIPFYEKDCQERPFESCSVLEHLRRAIEFTHGDAGSHGLPLLGFADWNDTVNLPKGAESLFTADLFGRALVEMGELSRMLGDETDRKRYADDYAALKKRVNACAWDGDWYVRYFDYDGAPLGSRTNAHGQIYINAQSWAVLSGFATAERARQAMDSVYARLNTSRGIKLSAPGFNGFDPKVGGVSTYPPGAKENGGIFLHTNPWAMIAETCLGNGDRAYQYYCQINPAVCNEEIERYQCEPYVYPQNILGDEHPQFGLARNSWLSGTASWTYQAGTQYILGVRPAYEGLIVDPCIPKAWDGFSVRRAFRGATYEIEVRNPNHVSKGVVELIANGQPVSGNVIPSFADGKVHTIQVILGEE